MAVILVLGGLTAASLTGCSGSQADAAQYTAPTPVPTSTSAVVTPGPTSTIHQRALLSTDDPQFQTSTITGPGVTKFGTRDAGNAYKTAVLFTMNQVADGPGLTKTGPITAADLAPFKAAMTASAFADLKAFTDKANTGDADATGQVQAVMARDLVAKSGLLYPTGTTPVASNKTFSSTTRTSVNGQKLDMWFTTGTDYQLLNSKKQPVTAHIKREVAYSMKLAGNGWLIDGWTINQSEATFTNG